MARYRQPHRLNPVSFLMLLVLAGAVYAGVKFAPPYWRDREVGEFLSEAANRLYRQRGVAGAEYQMKNEVTAKLRDMGIDDPQLTVSIERTAQLIRVSASYTVIVSHPFRKITRLRFSPSAETDTKSPFD